MTVYRCNERIQENSHSTCQKINCPCPYPYPPLPPYPPFPPVPPVPPTPQPTETIAYASFYALAPADNPTAIPAGAAVAFPNTASTSNGITQATPTVFTIAETGVYLIQFNATTSEAGQLQLTVNGVPVAGSTVGKTTASDQLQSFIIVPITTPNSTISVINPANATTAVTITPSAGGANATSSQLNIIRIA